MDELITDRRVLYSQFPHSSFGRAVWTRLKLGPFYNTISCLLVHGSSKRIHNLAPFLESTYLLSMIRCAMCHNSIGDWLHRYIFRGVCHVPSPSWLCHFKCLSQLPINSRIPPLPFTFLKFSSFTFVV